MTDDQTMQRPQSAPTTTSRPAELALLVAWSPARQKTGEWLVPEATPTSVGRSNDAGFSFAGDRFMSRIAARVARSTTADAMPTIAVEPQPGSNAAQRNLYPVGQPVILEEGDVLRLGSTVLLVAPIPSGSRCATDLGMVGVSPQLHQVRNHIQAWAKTPEPIHIQGETGTGKELAAAAIHHLSERAGAFVSVNAAAIPVELADSLLFGYRRGAFSGADQNHSGFFREAHRGTLFLDEVAELGPPVQAKLLRTIGTDTRVELQRVGDARPTEADVRLVTATHAELARRVQDGTFRADLYHRLTARTLTLPPLRHRQADIAVLVHHFWDTSERRTVRAMVEEDIELSWHVADIMERFLMYPWPGNVRELRNQCLRIPEALERWAQEGKPVVGPFCPGSGLSESIVRLGLGHRIADGPPEPLFGKKPPVHDDPNAGSDEPSSGADRNHPDGPNRHADKIILAMRTSAALTDLIRHEYQGNVRLFAHDAAEVLNRKVENVRRQVYLKLGEEGMRKLREEG